MIDFWNQTFQNKSTIAILSLVLFCISMSFSGPSKADDVNQPYNPAPYGVCQAVNTKNGNAPESLLEQGFRLLQAREYGESQRVFQSVIDRKTNPEECIKALYGLTKAQINLHQLQKANSTLDTAIKMEREFRDEPLKKVSRLRQFACTKYDLNQISETKTLLKECRTVLNKAGMQGSDEVKLIDSDEKIIETDARLGIKPRRF